LIQIIRIPSAIPFTREAVALVELLVGIAPTISGQNFAEAIRNKTNADKDALESRPVKVKNFTNSFNQAVKEPELIRLNNTVAETSKAFDNKAINHSSQFINHHLLLDDRIIIETKEYPS
jgi:hypothetical protein